VRREVSEEQLHSLPESLPTVLRRVYAARGAGPDDLDTSLGSLLPVSTLPGTAEAAARLATARANGERVLVVGDFDADGATSSALMIRCLRRFGFVAPDYLVPDRFRLGYGLSAPLVEEALVRSPDLIITVDNGISSIGGVARANEAGIDVIVTDHHLPGAALPDAAVIVNPNLHGSTFGSRALAGVGVAFYVMAALGQRLAADGYVTTAEARAAVADCLDLVALGTVADLVPMDRNNRVLVAQGLKRIRSGHACAGLEALFAAAGRSPTDATAADLGFGVAPRLNAAGRLEDMSLGIACLLGSNSDAAARAEVLSNLNTERRQLQQRMQAEAELHLETLADAAGDDGLQVACLYDPAWHQGVVGLVATRIREQLNRPVFAFADGEQQGVLKGSGRSVSGVHLRDLLATIDARQPGPIERFGGHAMAAGLSLRRESLAEFRICVDAEMARHMDTLEESRCVMSDGELAAAELTLDLAETLRVAGPWGQGFPEPMFDGRFRVSRQRIVGERHLKLALVPADGNAAIDAIAFNHPAPLTGIETNEFRVAYRLDVNDFRGRRSRQLVVEHIECV